VCSKEAEERHGNRKAAAWQKAKNPQDDFLNVTIRLGQLVSVASSLAIEILIYVLVDSLY